MQPAPLQRTGSDNGSGSSGGVGPRLQRQLSHASSGGSVGQNGGRMGASGALAKGTSRLAVASGPQVKKQVTRACAAAHQAQKLLASVARKCGHGSTIARSFLMNQCV